MSLGGSSAGETGINKGKLSKTDIAINMANAAAKMSQAAASAKVVSKHSVIDNTYPTTRQATNSRTPSAVRKLTESHLNQILVLRAMAGKLPNTEGLLVKDGKGDLHLQIEEISEVTNLDDEKEIQRILYILEGQKLVAPYPEGDFTSRIWHITREGTAALKGIEKSLGEE